MRIVWNESGLIIPGLIALATIAVGLFLSYRRKQGIPIAVRWLAGSLKWTGFAFLLFFLLRPEVVRPFNRPGTNHWVILSDNSASMTLKDQAGGKSRADRLNEILTPKPAGWQEKLGEDFIVDPFSFDRRLHRNGTDLSFDGEASHLVRALGDLRNRYEGRPLAGILVITDGTPTDSAALDGTLKGMPPVFPLVITPEETLLDLAVSNLTAQATLFEDAPVIVDATFAARGLTGRSVIVTARENGGKVLEEQRHTPTAESETWSARFQVRPEQSGTAFIEVDLRLETPGNLVEATLENNHRLVAANRDTGPYRVLYLGGRPNYEHKFLQRALEEDPDVAMTSLIRIARREPKFEYRSREGERSNPLYRGFEAQEEAERFDEAVFLRLKTKDSDELAGGFPKTAAELFPFDTIILDDVEAAFFDREQLRLLQRFVSERGGSVLMLGGMESLDAGGYAGTPIGEMLPVYLEPATPSDGPFAGRFNLTREGRLEPWARLRQTEAAEATRLRDLPEFQNIHRLPAIRPGAMEIGTLELASGETSPALVTRRYGRGRTAVIAMGDLWRWALRDPESQADVAKTWRQTTRWLLADVPRPLAVKAVATDDGQQITAELLGDDFQPSETGGVTLRVRRPDASWTSVPLRPHVEKSGTLESLYAATAPGPYLAEATTRATEGRPALTACSGWVVNAMQDEYAALQPDMETIKRLAATTGGQVLTSGGLDDFVASLKNLPLPVTETRSEPLWHSPLWLIAALACFVGEWALRRWKQLV